MFEVPSTLWPPVPSAVKNRLSLLPSDMEVTQPRIKEAKRACDKQSEGQRCSDVDILEELMNFNSYSEADMGFSESDSIVEPMESINVRLLKEKLPNDCQTSFSTTWNECLVEKENTVQHFFSLIPLHFDNCDNKENNQNPNVIKSVGTTSVTQQRNSQSLVKEHLDADGHGKNDLKGVSVQILLDRTNVPVKREEDKRTVVEKRKKNKNNAAFWNLKDVKTVMFQTRKQRTDVFYENKRETKRGGQPIGWSSLVQILLVIVSIMVKSTSAFGASGYEMTSLEAENSPCPGTDTRGAHIYTRHPGNCAIFYTCFGTRVWQMACTKERTVFSLKHKVCVWKNSKFDDCSASEGLTTISNNSSQPQGEMLDFSKGRWYHSLPKQPGLMIPPSVENDADLPFYNKMNDTGSNFLKLDSQRKIQLRHFPFFGSDNEGDLESNNLFRNESYSSRILETLRLSRSRSTPSPFYVNNGLKIDNTRTTPFKRWSSTIRPGQFQRYKYADGVGNPKLKMKNEGEFDVQVHPMIKNTDNLQQIPQNINDVKKLVTTSSPINEEDFTFPSYFDQPEGVLPYLRYGGNLSFEQKKKIKQGRGSSTKSKRPVATPETKTELFDQKSLLKTRTITSSHAPRYLTTRYETSKSRSKIIGGKPLTRKIPSTSSPRYTLTPRPHVPDHSLKTTGKKSISTNHITTSRHPQTTQSRSNNLDVSTRHHTIDRLPTRGRHLSTTTRYPFHGLDKTTLKRTKLTHNYKSIKKTTTTRFPSTSITKVSYHQVHSKPRTTLQTTKRSHTGLQTSHIKTTRHSHVPRTSRPRTSITRTSPRFGKLPSSTLIPKTHSKQVVPTQSRQSRVVPTVKMEAVSNPVRLEHFLRSLNLRTPSGTKVIGRSDTKSRQRNSHSRPHMTRSYQRSRTLQLKRQRLLSQSNPTAPPNRWFGYNRSRMQRPSIHSGHRRFNENKRNRGLPLSHKQKQNRTDSRRFGLSQRRNTFEQQTKKNERRVQHSNTRVTGSNRQNMRKYGHNRSYPTFNRTLGYKSRIHSPRFENKTSSSLLSTNAPRRHGAFGNLHRKTGTNQEDVIYVTPWGRNSRGRVNSNNGQNNRGRVNSNNGQNTKEISRGLSPKRPSSYKTREETNRSKSTSPRSRTSKTQSNNQSRQRFRSGQDKMNWSKRLQLRPSYSLNKTLFTYERSPKNVSLYDLTKQRQSDSRANVERLRRLILEAKLRAQNRRENSRTTPEPHFSANRSISHGLWGRNQVVRPVQTPPTSRPGPSQVQTLATTSTTTSTTTTARPTTTPTTTTTTTTTAVEPEYRLRLKGKSKHVTSDCD
ncbi:uncharacterized protein LOC101863157 [Aplysia californica]|uniref:Uncharacterized protein LOC101863157 n=1 Tax=Aplysia californica TaxID=6500 RepID=A0ABM1AA38_APLCA|nr:uncharacterized protein LOC101863157 [Aplysia californica]XP_012943740.1 uncharacterized protein LOC101863157 [Aplysia californica]